MRKDFDQTDESFPRKTMFTYSINPPGEELSYETEYEPRYSEYSGHEYQKTHDLRGNSGYHNYIKKYQKKSNVPQDDSFEPRRNIASEIQDMICRYLNARFVEHKKYRDWEKEIRIDSILDITKKDRCFQIIKFSFPKERKRFFMERDCDSYDVTVHQESY